MLTNTADGIVKWLKENKRGLTFHFRNRGALIGNNLQGRDWTIYIRENAVKIPYGKVVEKDCISIIDNYTYNFKQAKMRFKKEKIERICREEDCD